MCVITQHRGFLLPTWLLMPFDDGKQKHDCWQRFIDFPKPYLTQFNFSLPLNFSLVLTRHELIEGKKIKSKIQTSTQNNVRNPQIRNKKIFGCFCFRLFFFFLSKRKSFPESSSLVSLPSSNHGCNFVLIPMYVIIFHLCTDSHEQYVEGLYGFLRCR